MQSYLGPPWTDSHPIWAVDAFHRAPPIHGIQNTEIQKSFVMSSLLYSILNDSQLAKTKKVNSLHIPAMTFKGRFLKKMLLKRAKTRQQILLLKLKTISGFQDSEVWI